MEQLVEIELFGQPYTFRTESEANRAQEAAEFLVREVARVESQHEKASAKLGHLTIMILTALNIANENMHLKQNQLSFLHDVTKRSDRLIRRIEQYVQ